MVTVKGEDDIYWMNCKKCHGTFTSRSCNKYIRAVKLLKTQSELKKMNLPADWVLLVADFAENYRTFYQDEIQAAHWQYQQITVHPIVAYLKCPEEQCRDTSLFIKDKRSVQQKFVYQQAKQKNKRQVQQSEVAEPEVAEQPGVETQTEEPEQLQQPDGEQQPINRKREATAELGEDSEAQTGGVKEPVPIRGSLETVDSRHFKGSGRKKP
ncbi:Hypothetical predicted protein [Mytilus galloprovincialis]|uniref:Uncharacterized protein n=1 Tax=Mytilus galloprovincialis TaxID=29158 RepID=A0A8B6CSR9_MYTGA|nr:Hypothetical predicted protein [Mytilus galloprovincialis]